MEDKQKAGIAVIAATAVVTGAVLLRKKERYPENIVLSDLQIVPPEVEVGDTVEISCTAYNAGAERATRKIELEVS